jgi:hypothetical protein
LQLRLIGRIAIQEPSFDDEDLLHICASGN